MKQIRECVFETNSSSTHSVSISHRNDPVDLTKNYCELNSFIESDTYLHISYGAFGWGYDVFDDPLNKLSYLITMIGEIYNIDGWYTDIDFDELRNQIEGNEEFQLINNYIKEICNCSGIWVDRFDGYIDHQSCENYSCLNDFLDDWGTDLVNFIFNPNVKLIIDNDNH